MATKPSLAEIHAGIACVQRLAAAFADRREQLATTVGLTEHQWGVLEQIATEHFMPSMFARQRRSTPAAVSKTLRQLVDKGLITAQVGKDDARQRMYELTARGTRIMNRLREGREAAIQAIWTDLDSDELRTFTRFGARLTERMEAYVGNQQTSEKNDGKDAVRESV